MQSHSLFKTIALLPLALKHLNWVKHQLNNKSYEQILHDKYPLPDGSAKLQDIVKSYFWACRLIPTCHCLPRSIALYQGLKSRGFKAEHKFGIYKTLNQFKAHAWVEFENKPLNEHADLLKRFKVLQGENKSSYN